jgi:hypothetical protein
MTSNPTGPIQTGGRLGVVACLTVPPLGVKGASHPLRGRPRAAALDPEPPAARPAAVRAGQGPPQATATTEPGTWEPP